MIIILKSGVDDAAIDDVCRRVTEMGYAPHIIRGEFKTIVAAVGEERGRPDLRLLEAVETVESVMPVQQPFKLASREVRQEPSEVRVNGVTIGGKAIVVMAGPCSVESEAQMQEVADAVKAAGAKILRGGAFKPRTSPYAFQGLKEQGLKYLADARKRTGLPIVTEVLETESVELVAQYADILQIGARNIQNFTLLRRVGEMGKPVLLKRGMATSIQEFLLSAEYILAAGNPNDDDALHARSQRGAGAQEALAPAGGRRSLARDRALGSGRADGQGGGRVRGGRTHHRGASEAGGGALRRAAVAQAVEVRAAHARAAPRRRSRRPELVEAGNMASARSSL